MIRLHKTVSLLVLLALQIYGQDFEDKFYEQKLDHSGANPGTWKQRYLENAEFFKPGGPIFVRLGGPFYSPVGPEALKKGSMYHHAKQQGAHLVQLESRFYGKSRPTSDLSTENLQKYLTIENGLEDSAAFIKWFKSQPQFKGSKVVAFGHVYSGSRIVQNMRTQPGLIDVGVLSSTPVETRFELPEYSRAEIEILRGVNPECATTVHDAILCFDKMVNGETCEGHKIADIKEEFNLCAEEDPSKPMDNAALIGEILTLVGQAVLLDNPAAEYNVHKMCEAMGDTSNGKTHIDKLAVEITKLLKLWKKPCLEFRFEELEKSLENTSWEQGEKTDFQRTEMYSRCKYSMTLRTPEGLDLPEDRIESYRAYHLEMCKRAFGLSREDVMSGTEMTNKKYGMRMIPSKCTIFMTEGEDLLKSLEITTQEEAGKCNAVIESQDGGILADEIDAVDGENVEYGRGLKESETRAGKLIDQWLKTGDCCAAVSK